MHIYKSFDDARALPRGGVVTIGNFDGLHLGHQALLQTLHARARAFGPGTPKAVVTFDPHPMVYFKGLKPEDFYLSSVAQRVALLEAQGVDAVLILPFDHVLAAMSADDFVRAALVEAVGPREVWVGHDFRFGQGRGGSIADLQRLGARYGFEAQALGAVVDATGAAISSSRVRALLDLGDVGQVRALLGRPYGLRGEVRRGDGRGKTLGVPTANIGGLPQRMPALGVYVTTLTCDSLPGVTLHGVTNVGRRPTFHGALAEVVVETFLLDPQATALDLYDQAVEVNLLKFLRPERRFDDATALVAQIQQDVQAARQLHGL
jgi:riboflavin kinase/FMN adenylyltransferase